MALARRVLTVLTAAALALAPVGVASAASQGRAHHTATALSSHTTHGDHAAVKLAGTESAKSSAHCMGKGKVTATHERCCTDEGACADACMQKCFGQMALLPPDRMARVAHAHHIAPLPAERPPGWSSAPQPPPPRA